MRRLGITLAAILALPATMASAATIITRGAASARAYGFSTPTSAKDPFFSSVKMLMHYDGTNGSTTFTDVTGLNSFSALGSAALSTTQIKFGSASLHVGGATDEITTSGASPAIGTGDWTAEAWVYPTALPTGSNYATILTNLASGIDTTTGSWLFCLRGPGQLEIFISGAPVLNAGTGTLTTNTWSHVAVTKASGVYKLWLNGTQVGTSASNAVSLPSYNHLSVGKLTGDSSGTGVFVGYIDDERLTVGVARYTSNFTPPTKPFPNH